jgi:hypothetical protein
MPIYVAERVWSESQFLAPKIDGFGVVRVTKPSIFGTIKITISPQLLRFRPNPLNLHKLAFICHIIGTLTLFEVYLSHYEKKDIFTNSTFFQILIPKIIFFEKLNWHIFIKFDEISIFTLKNLTSLELAE